VRGDNEVLRIYTAPAHCITRSRDMVTAGTYCPAMLLHPTMEVVEKVHIMFDTDCCLGYCVSKS
jgi:hypothetical protein